MIRTFRNDETANVFRQERVTRFPPNILRSAVRKLNALDFADNLTDLSLTPGNRFEALRGDRAGQYSVRINDQWRLCFRWSDGDAYDIEIVDYH